MRTNAGVYEIVNTVNGHRYIGSSTNLKDRRRLHFQDLNKNTHTNPHLQSAWNKYGAAIFDFRVLLYCDKDMTLVYEQSFLDRLNPEYNIVKNAAAPNKGRTFSAEVRAKISRAGIGRVLSEETRRKIGNAHKGRKKTAEEIKKHADAIRGKSMSEQARQNMSKAGKGRKFSGDHKAKIGAKTKSRWDLAEYRQRLSKALTGRVFSEEAKQKLRDAWNRRRARMEK